jgi:hypothetical protein
MRNTTREKRDVHHHASLCRGQPGLCLHHTNVDGVCDGGTKHPLSGLAFGSGGLTPDPLPEGAACPLPNPET